MAQPTVYLFTPAAHAHLTPYVAALHASCITHDGLIATFLPPLHHEKLLAWWKERIAEVAAGTRVIVLLLEESEPGSRAKGTELVGVVMLGMPPSETGPFRGFVEKLLVNPKNRSRGFARMMLGALEGEAVRRGKTLLVSFVSLCSVRSRCSPLLVSCLHACFYSFCVHFTHAVTNLPHLTTVADGRHGIRQRGRGGVQEAWVRRRRHRPTVREEPGRPAQGRDIFLQGPVVALEGRGPEKWS